MSKIDDDSVIEFKKLDSILDEVEKDPREETISCPTVIRNQRTWRHPEAKTMGKWAISEVEMPEKLLPDYCNGLFYVTSPKGGLGLAVTARIMGNEAKPDVLNEDFLITGFLQEKLPWLSLRSLSPVGGAAWDSFFSHCPILTLIRWSSFNPLVVGAGSPDSPHLQYVNNPYFLLCLVAEHVMYDYLRHVGITQRAMDKVCARK